MANSTVKCRITSGTGVPEDCTGANINTITGVTTNGTAAVGQIPGTTTNDNAAAGKIGETSPVAFAAGVSQANNTITNLTSASLTAGDWDIWCSVQFVPAGTTTVTAYKVGISTANNTIAGNIFDTIAVGQASSAPVQNSQITAGPAQVQPSATTTYFCNTFALFGTSTLTATGQMRARRVR